MGVSEKGWPVAVDVGFADVKVASFAPGPSDREPFGELRTLVIPSQLERGGQRLTTLKGNERVGRGFRTVEPSGVEERWTYRQPLLNPEDTRIPNYHTSSLNRALLAHALVAAAEEGVIPAFALSRGVMLATSLPVSEFMLATGAINTEYVNAKRKWLLDGEVYYTTDGDREARIEFRDHRVYCQAISAWCDYVLGPDGYMRDDRVEEEVGVIDVGGDTTDFAVMVSTPKGHSIDPSRSSGIRLGVLHAVDELRALMSAELGEAIPPGPAREVLAKGYTKIRGKEYRCPKLVAKARQSMSERLKRELGRRWRGREHTLTMSRILVVGGGANLLDRAELEKTYPQAMWPEEPQFANARGMLNYLVNVELRSVYRPWSSTL